MLGIYNISDFFSSCMQRSYSEHIYSPLIMNEPLILYERLLEKVNKRDSLDINIYLTCRLDVDDC